MRVCHATSLHPPFDVRIFHKECQTLRRAGYEVTLLAQADWTERVVDGVRVIGLPQISARRQRPRVWRHIVRQVRRLQPDLGPPLAEEERQIPMKEKLKLLRAGILPFLIFFFMTGLFLMGVTSLVESSAVGAASARLTMNSFSGRVATNCWTCSMASANISESQESSFA